MNVSRTRVGWRRWFLLGNLLGALAAGAQTLAPNPEAVGLWAGEVVLNQVTHARSGTNALTVDTAQMRLVLHVSTNGEVRLLKDVMLVRRRAPLRPTSVDPTGESNWMLLTDSSLLPTIRSLSKRSGKFIGQRVSSVGYDFDGLDRLLAGGIGRNFRCEGTLLLPADHPTNPFRHRYHPEHANGLPIQRQVAMRFTAPATITNGATQWVGDYEETVTGLHRAPLTVRGTVTFNRISMLGFLNQ